MVHRQDNQLATTKLATGIAPGQLNSLEPPYVDTLAAVDPTSGDAQDAWHEFWDEEGIAIGNYGDRAFAWLGGLGFTGDLASRWKAYWETLPGAQVTNFFNFAGDSSISIPFDPDPAVATTMECIFKASVGGLDVVRDIFGSQDTFYRLRTTLDVRINLFGTLANHNSLAIIEGVESRAVLFWPSTATDGRVELDGVSAAQGKGVTDQVQSMQIGSRTVGTPWIGVVREFKIYSGDFGTLLHHYPINEGGGTVINDLVGGQDGTLTIGSGGWN